jgi:nucleotide-binding universal stress UspA family protein
LNAVRPSTGKLHLVVGYDGSVPATRALDSAVALLRDREGSIDVLYVTPLTFVEKMSADAIASLDGAGDELTRNLRAQAAGQLHGREERWTFGGGRGVITDLLIEAADRVRGAHPDDNVVIVVGSSSQARHRMVGSVAVSLIRHAPVPLLIVP